MNPHYIDETNAEDILPETIADIIAYSDEQLSHYHEIKAEGITKLQAYSTETLPLILDRFRAMGGWLFNSLEVMACSNGSTASTESQFSSPLAVAVKILDSMKPNFDEGTTGTAYKKQLQVIIDGDEFKRRLRAVCGETSFSDNEIGILKQVVNINPNGGATKSRKKAAIR